MRGPITKELVALLGRAAGFELAPERCKLLVPQLDWLLGEAVILASLDLSCEEPNFICLTGVFSSFASDKPQPATDELKTQGRLP
jgi:hypothetical protein